MGRRAFNVNAVFSMIISPSIKIWGRMPITRKMEIKVPRPRHTPMEAMAGLEDSRPMEMPAEARMVPEVTMVGKASFSDSMTASFRDMVCFSST